MSDSNQLVTHTVTDGIAHVRLARPEKLNALTLQTLDELVATAQELRRDRTLRAVILSGEGPSFCAGLDFGSVLKQPAGIVGAFVPRPWRGTNTFQEACWAWRRLPVPVIAAVRGHCYGGGLQIALAADFRIATPDSEWSVLEGRWGIIPDMTGVRSLAELVGIDTAKRLTMTAQMFSGKEAARPRPGHRARRRPGGRRRGPGPRADDPLPRPARGGEAAVQRDLDASPRRTFARERVEQLFLLVQRQHQGGPRGRAAEGGSAVRTPQEALNPPR